MKYRHHNPVQFNKVHHNDQDRSNNQKRFIVLFITVQKNDKWNNEPAGNQAIGDYRPASLEPVIEPQGLFRNIGIIDKKELAERDIGVKDSETKEPGSQIINMGFCNCILQQAILMQPERGKNQSREESLKAHCKKVDAKHSGKPVRIKRHQPVETCKCNRERKNKNTGCADFTQQGSKAPVVGTVHLSRYFVQLIAKISPD